MNELMLFYKNENCYSFEVKTPPQNSKMRLQSYSLR